MSFVKVTAAARSQRLCRLSDLRDKLGITGVSEDAELERLIESTGREFANILGRAPWHQSYNERLPGEGGIFLPLTCWPISSITSVSEDGTAVSSSDYEVGGTQRDSIFREDGWIFTSVRSSWHSEQAGDHNQTYSVVYSAGWLMPSELADWDGGEDYEVGHWVRSSDPTTPVLFECTTAGTSSDSEPSWDTTEGATTTDGTAVWTAREAEVLPRDLEQAALMRAADAYRETLADAMVASESFDGMRLQYREPRAGLTNGVLQLLKNYT